MSEPPRTIRPDIQSIGGRPRTTKTTESLSSILQSPSRNPDVFISNAASRQLARTKPKDGGQVPSIDFAFYFNLVAFFYYHQLFC